MIVTWIAIQSQPVPWQEARTDVAYVACGESAGELSLIRRREAPQSPALTRLLASLERAVALKQGVPSLAWLRQAMPDQGTSIRLSPPRQCQAESYEAQVLRLATD